MNLHELRPLKNFFQHGYVTNDFDRAITRFADYGITRWAQMRDLDVHVIGDKRATMSIALAWYGHLQVEIIHPRGGDCQVYAEYLPGGEEFALRLHHHGFLLYDEEEYFGLRDEYASRGAATVIDGLNPRSGNRYFYADTRPELGHYIEYVYLTPQGVADYAKLPQNAAEIVPGPGLPGSRE